MNVPWEQGWAHHQQQPPPLTVPTNQSNNYYSHYWLPANNKMAFPQSQCESHSRPVDSDADVEEASRKHQLRKEQRKMTAFAALSLVILIFNTAVLVAYARRVGSPEPTIPLFQGTCTETARFSLWVHVLINALALCLSLVSANGMRNVRLVHEAQPSDAGGDGDVGPILICFLASLLPIYIFYNATIYQVVGANAYYAAAVGEDFFSAGTLPAALADNSNFTAFVAAYGDMRTNGSSWVRMGNLECIETYSTGFLNDYRNLILVASNRTSPEALYQAFYIDWRSYLGQPSLFDYFSPALNLAVYSWMCPPAGENISTAGFWSAADETCTLSSLESGATAWAVPFNGLSSIYGPNMLPSPVEYCLAEPSPSQCSVGLNWYFLLVVAACNAVKLICQLLSRRLLRRRGRMSTVGDQRRHLSEKRPTRWIQAYSWHGIILLLCIIALLVGIALWQALRTEETQGQPIDITSLWNLGFGTVSPNSTLNGLGLGLGHTASTGAILGVSLLANIPQLIVTLLFFNFSHALTVMEAHSKYAKPNLTAAQLAKPARDLPLYYTVIAGAIQVVVHWVASQAFFPVILNTPTSELDYWGSSSVSLGDGGLYITVGFSPIAIIFTLIFLFVAFSFLSMAALRKYRWG